MFPMEFDHKVLDSLPFPEEEGIKRVLQILEAIIVARIMPYFRNKRCTDSTLIARVSSHFTIQRMEDEEKRIATVSLVSMKDGQWTIFIHERVFDYLAFVIPSNPESRLGGKTTEEAKMLAFAEFFLRHQIEHLLYPQKAEREVIDTDVIFAMEKRNSDPTYYRMLRNALADELNGLNGSSYLALFDAAEEKRTYEYIIAKILNASIESLSKMPNVYLQGLFPFLDMDLKRRLLGDLYQKSRNPSYSLRRRNIYLENMMRLFSIAVNHDEKEAQKIFHAFKDRWGLIYLFHALDLPDLILEEKSNEEIFDFFKENLAIFSEEKRTAMPSFQAGQGFDRHTKDYGATPVKSLKDRIEEARNNPNFPRQAIDVIEKNKTSAVGHSGPKYTELIETLLAIPWGKIQNIDVRPEDFEEGLNQTHYGLKKPKEILCDFFTNLIWRYHQTIDEEEGNFYRTGSSFLLVGPPGVGKTSLAISLAKNMNIPYHKISLGGMSDETDLRGHGFTWEGSKPGAIVQGLIKMGIMNGMFIMDEADKTEKFAISTLLEILDPEQNHLFHDKYTQTIIDIDLSRCHFILTANTLDTVPPAVVNRCEVVLMDRYGIEEKVAIAQQHLITRIRRRYRISEEDIFFKPGHEADLLRYLIKTYTYEAGVRQLERIIRTLFLRVFRKQIMMGDQKSVQLDREMIKKYLETPTRPWQINEEDRVGEMLALGVNLDRGIGSIIPIQATRIQFKGDEKHVSGGYLSMVHATGSIEKILDESRKVATTGIFYCSEPLEIDRDHVKAPIHLHFMGASTPKDGPSAGGSIGLALTSVLTGRPIRRDVAMTGEIDTQGRILAVGGLDVKLETAIDVGCKTMIIPKANLRGEGGIERLPEALKQDLQILTYEDWKKNHPPFDYKDHVLQVVAVDHILQAVDITFINPSELDALETLFVPHARSIAGFLEETLKSPRECCCLFHPKEPEELNIETFKEPFWQRCNCMFILQPEVKKIILEKHPGMEKRVRFFDIAPSQEEVPLGIQEIKESLSGKFGMPSRISLVAPYYFLIHSGLSHMDRPISSYFRDLRSFANNFTRQGFKIKECKPVLNRVLCHLAMMSTEQLESCPFLIRDNGIYMVDLSFIPEKYRLDIKRTETILNRCLKAWLTTLESNLKLEHEAGISAFTRQTTTTI
ncbi:MAG: AAA family ATPase [Deltaproteobacteria bacterium]|nr:AAA family ATPase [Deltaproteobacteria bacterium]